MQNLSFQLTQNTPLKNLAESIKKNEASIESSSTGEAANTPFQLMLSKQLQAQTKQGSAEHVEVEHSTKSKANNAKTTNVAVNELAVNENGVGDLITNDVGNSVNNLSPAFIGQVGLDPATSLAKKEDVDNKAEVAVIDSMSTNASVVASIMQPIAIDKSQVTTAVASSNIESQMSSKLEAAKRSQQGIVAGLSNSLLQAKNANIPEKDAGNTQPTGDHVITLNEDRWSDMLSKQSSGNLPTENKGMIGVFKDGALSNTTGQTFNDESSKLALKDAKESIVKGMAIPANYQPVAQMNATIPVLQVGSTNYINAYPGKTGWDQAISQKVVWMVGAGEQSATLTLNPPDLGPLQVVINVNNDKADTTFISNNAEVRQALQDGMANLREKMGESGIQLGQANVSSGGQSQQDFQQAKQNRPDLQLNNNVPALSIEKPTNVSTLVRVANGLVDTFV